MCGLSMNSHLDFSLVAVLAATVSVVRACVCLNILTFSSCKVHVCTLPSPVFSQP